MQFVVIVSAAGVAWVAVAALAWPWWASVPIFLVASPVIAWGIAMIARQLSLGPALLSTGGPPANTPQRAVFDAYVAVGEAARVRHKVPDGEDRAARAWAQLRAAAGAAHQVSVLESMDAWEASSGPDGDEGKLRAANHRLRVEIESL